MDRAQFETHADRLRAYARELQATVEDCVVQATHSITGTNTTGLAGASPDESGASLALGGICPRLEELMAAYDRHQEAVGGTPRYQRLLEHLRSERGGAGGVLP